MSEEQKKQEEEKQEINQLPTDSPIVEETHVEGETISNEIEDTIDATPLVEESVAEVTATDEPSEETSAVEEEVPVPVVEEPAELEPVVQEEVTTVVEEEVVTVEAESAPIVEKEVNTEIEATPAEEVITPVIETAPVEEALAEATSDAVETKPVEATSVDLPVEEKEIIDVVETAPTEEVITPAIETAPVGEASSEPVTASAVVETESAEDTPEEEDNSELPDYTTFNREQLVEAIEAATQIGNFSRTDLIVVGVEPLFRTFESNIRAEAQAKYIADGGIEEDFEFRHDAFFNRFDASLRLIKDRKSAHYREREANKTRNLEKKQELLERLRELVDGEQATGSIKPIKEIQEEWKAIGSVPNQQGKTLWANYNALLDRFYHNRQILFELKDLDRKRNHTAKSLLCEKAEALGAIDSVKDAVIQLNELHEEYKSIGAVPREAQEALWQRFKAASDVVYRKRKDFLEHLKGDLKENLVKKQDLIKALVDYSSFDSDRINDWNAKTKEILALQKSWEAIGGVPREKAKDINRAFWSAFKGFFANKNEFFKKLEALRKVNLEQKEVLIQEAIALQESDEWDKTAEKLKQLQSKWKEVGPVPEKQRNAIYARFKEACDTFFNNKRTQLNQAESAYVENHEKKEALLDQIAEQTKAKEGSEEELMTLIAQYNELGFVPRNSIKSLEAKFKKVVADYVTSLELAESEAETLMLKAELSVGNKGEGADRKLQKKESTLRRKINELEDNISLWNNNLAFFANSKTADKLKEEFNIKISKAEEEVQSLKKQLRVIRSI